MTDRGLPIVDGAPACPFVAFDDERDARATSPDHRHRCYAEVRPAPRALAHQEAYCLSSAFPICPTFQDWAKREAAKAHAGAEPAEAYAGAEPAEPARRPAEPHAADLAEPGSRGTPGSTDPTSSRNPPRSWAAPPPWMTGSASDEFDEDDRAVLPSTPSRGSGLSGSFADRLAGGASAAPLEAVPGFAAPEPEAGAGRAEGPLPPRRGAPPARLPNRTSSNGADRGRPEDEEVQERGPSWERPRRREAYPPLKSRIGLPSMSASPILASIAAVVLAAVALFFLPTLLGIVFSPAASRAPSTSVPGSSPAASPTIAAVTAVPKPTAQVYVVQAGDTMSRIASKFGVPLQLLVDTNKATIPNPDVLALGQQVIIPVVAPTSVPGSSNVTEAPSTLP